MGDSSNVTPHTVVILDAEGSVIHGGVMVQTAAYPHELRELVESFIWRGQPVITASLDHLDRGQGCVGLTLTLRAVTTNSYEPYQRLVINHLFPVPAAAFDRRSWNRWLFDRVGDVQLHERCEFYETDGGKPYAPSHGPGNDPYLIREVGTDLDRKTSFRGDVNDG